MTVIPFPIGSFHQRLRRGKAPVHFSSAVDLACAELAWDNLKRKHRDHLRNRTPETLAARKQAVEVFVRYIKKESHDRAAPAA